jgi:LPXTG-site transpeptidase (sortase) family protein
MNMSKDHLSFHLPKWKATLLAALILLVNFPSPVRADSSVPQTDQTPVTPLVAPGSPARPRYISGFGTDNAYTIFFEDRANQVGCANPETYRIYFNQTTSGPAGFSPFSTPTDLCETHFTVKNWPITIGPNTYAYRGWGAQGNNPNHGFYVSNNLTNWTPIFVGPGMFSDPHSVLTGDQIYYGFHDIVQLNSNYIGFAESNGGNTYIVWSDNGDQHWEVVAKVGGAVPGVGPLNLYFFPGITGSIPSGNFLLMEIGGQTVYGKLMVPGDRSGAYLAINRAAAQAATPALAETAFMNPANWTWQDATTGLPGAANRVLTSTYIAGPPPSGHDIRELWSAPTSSPRSDHVTLYTANYGSAAGAFVGLGCAAGTPQCLVVPPPDPSDPSAASLPASGFAPGRVTRLVPQPADRAYSPADIRLEIPALGVNVLVVGVPLVNGSWDVTWLSNQAGYLDGTAFPTHPGNSALTAHVYNADGRPGPFVALHSLVYGDRVILHAWGYRYLYEVHENLLISPSDLSVLKHEEYSWLTLLTCQGFDQNNNRYLFRRAVRAVLVSVLAEQGLASGQ